jgi:non-ribosomal peptide synthetase component F
MEREPGLTENDVLLSLTPISFDIAGLEQFLPLVAGATLVPAPTEVRSDGAALGELIERCSATVVQATPSTLELLLDGGWRPGSHVKLLCGGEALSARLAGRLAAEAGSLWNMYGPTETTIWSSVRRISGDGVDIGAPIANTRLYITDEALSPSPAGVAGELSIAGAGLARGYHGRPALTAERFVPDPFSATPGQRMYRTGDRVRRRAGRLQFLGRIDDQLKVRGARVEPAEIEAALCGIPPVTRAAACQVEDANAGRLLVAYIVVDGDAPSAETLRAELSRTLPAAMIPQRFERLDRMPTTPSGKLDRPRLGARTLAPLAGRGATARGEVEFVLASIWADVLGVSEPGVEQNFFDLGGTSLAMGRVHVRAQERFGCPLALIDFLRYPTIRDLAASLGGPDVGRGATHADDARRRARMRKRRLASMT